MSMNKAILVPLIQCQLNCKHCLWSTSTGHCLFQQKKIIIIMIKLINDIVENAEQYPNSRLVDLL